MAYEDGSTMPAGAAGARASTGRGERVYTGPGSTPGTGRDDVKPATGVSSAIANASNQGRDAHSALNDLEKRLEASGVLRLPSARGNDEKLLNPPATSELAGRIDDLARSAFQIRNQIVDIIERLDV